MYNEFIKETGCFPCEVIEYDSFEQMWGSTALGFSGTVGCDAMTTATTTILKHTRTEKYGVMFGGRLAYVVEEPTEEFFDDVKNHSMVSVANKNKYQID